MNVGRIVVWVFVVVAAKVHEGMTMSEVDALLGPAAYTRPVSGGGMEWVYSKEMKGDFYVVAFSAEGKVVNAEWDD